MAIAVPATPNKILVAVHGIGDQVGYATAQSVAAQIGAYYDISASIPLGRFYGADAGGAAGAPKPMPILMKPPRDPAQFRGIGFAEVYWAEIPRTIVKTGYILEETKRWARTVSGRLALRAMEHRSPMPERERVRMTTVLDEMIETVAVLERLNFVLAKAGLLKFNLNQLLTDFLGDVQIVVDFEAYRDEILTGFATVMDDALSLSPTPSEIYLIAHSEGSVLTFMALLAALADPVKHAWIESVRGVMTIGSPIEVHHLLWPELWEQLLPDPSLTPLKIPWHNYFDYGDPIAYGLDRTKRWMQTNRFDQHLQLTETGFGRSYLPGKAHVDYWEDNELFAHFIGTVVRPPEPCPRPGSPPEPGNKWWAIGVSYAVPQLLIAAFLCLATYFLYRPAAAAVMANGLTALTVGRDVLGISLLLLGTTAAARIPRLTNKWRWWVLAGVMLAASMAAYEVLVIETSRVALGSIFIGTRAGHASAADVEKATRGVQISAGLIALSCGLLASWWPRRGVLLLPAVGLLVALGLVGRLLWDRNAHIEVWPVVVGATLFFYFWWVAALLFDLVFIWHRYIRHSVALHSIAEISDGGYVPSKLEAAINRVRMRPVKARR